LDDSIGFAKTFLRNLSNLISTQATSHFRGYVLPGCW